MNKSMVCPNQDRHSGDADRSILPREVCTTPFFESCLIKGECKQVVCRSQCEMQLPCRVFLTFLSDAQPDPDAYSHLIAFARIQICLPKIVC
jgi:hypothetical protein